MKKVMLCFGTRPEAIKMCPLVHELQKRPAFKTVVCLSGQHKEMLEDVLHRFGVQANHNLAIMTQGQTLFDITVRILTGMKQILEEEKPDVVLVHGDTSTAFVTALACFYLQIPVGHVEAGLRTYQLDAPFPEEFNRQAVDIISRFYFAPTAAARANLLREGKEETKLYVTGNTAIDALKLTVTQSYRHPLLAWADDSRLILMTAHRRENLGAPMRQMFCAIRRIAEEYPDARVLYPIHMNPAVRKIADDCLAGCERIRLIEPLDVFDFHNFMARAHLILTDSGGIQEEAPSLGKPVLVMRETTERPEGIKAGTLRLVGTAEESIYQNIRLLLEDEKEYMAMSNASNPYGDGQASARIADALEADL